MKNKQTIKDALVLIGVFAALGLVIATIIASR